MIIEQNHPQFFTATIYEWNHLLKTDETKEIITNSLHFLTEQNRVTVYAFVIMSNHIHIIWRIKTPHILKDVQRDFLKFTGQQIKMYLKKVDAKLLENCKVNHSDRQYMIWKTDSLSVDLYTENVYNQKLDYVHNNPVKAGLCNLPEEYKYSSASFYETKQTKWKFLSKYDE